MALRDKFSTLPPTLSEILEPETAVRMPRSVLVVRGTGLEIGEGARVGVDFVTVCWDFVVTDGVFVEVWFVKRIYAKAKTGTITKQVMIIRSNRVFIKIDTTYYTYD